MAVAAQDETRVRRAGDDLFLAAGEIDWRSETSGDIGTIVLARFSPLYSGPLQAAA
jgi:hypothetical protein